MPPKHPRSPTIIEIKFPHIPLILLNLLVYKSISFMKVDFVKESQIYAIKRCQ